MVLLRSALGAMLLALSVLLAAPAAFAGEGEITFCNEFPHRVSIAIAYLQTDVNNHLTRGWLNVGTGKCYVRHGDQGQHLLLPRRERDL
jgi:uncharacterized membrane protein